ncbi:unnamed protein product [Cylicocyclus nassatus]|uniref:DDE-1 domain-containing protein n=1 Tax=Cylicocyclus nassatus TaxID=53992 RepID=A0AA36H2L6_CYLNA|nr:unnamed protein product [Cylicocyclus nassatus]
MAGAAGAMIMRRADLSMRASTSVGQHITANADELIANFRSFVKAEITTIPEDLGNMDEVPVTFDMPGRYTVDIRGTQDVGIAGTGSEKTNFTVVLGVTADGICPPMVIFKRKSVPKDTPPRIILKANAHGWMNEELMHDWVEEWMGSEHPAKSPEKALLILDAACCHITMEAKKAIQKRAKIAVMPGGLTKYLQPLDISVNNSFKAKLRNRWEEWMIMDDAKHSYTKQGHMRHATYREVCLWVLQSIQEVTAQCIRNGFRRALEEGQLVANEVWEDANE